MIFGMSQWISVVSLWERLGFDSGVRLRAFLFECAPKIWMGFLQFPASVQKTCIFRQNGKFKMTYVWVWEWMMSVCWHVVDVRPLQGVFPASLKSRSWKWKNASFRFSPKQTLFFKIVQICISEQLPFHLIKGLKIQTQAPDSNLCTGQ